MAEERQCVVVIVGADEYGRKELLAMIDGFRESAESWRELLLDLRRRGLKQHPKLAIGDGALGFWTALREVFATTREQRCWVHKTMNVLNALPKSLQDKAKNHLHDIWQAETKAEAGAAFGDCLCFNACHIVGGIRPNREPVSCKLSISEQKSGRKRP